MEVSRVRGLTRSCTRKTTSDITLCENEETPTKGIDTYFLHMLSLLLLDSRNEEILRKGDGNFAISLLAKIIFQ